MRNLERMIFVLLGLCALLNPNLSFADALTTPTTKEDIEKRILDRSKQLDALNQAIQTTQTSLNEVQQQKTSLQKDIKTLDYSLKQLNFDIQSDQVSSQKINYEIDSINLDLKDIEFSIDNKKKSIVDLFRELQRDESKNTLLLLLENKTLAEGLFATQAVDSVRTQLSTDINELNDLQNQYQTRLGDLGVKQQDLQVHQENLKNRKQIVEDVKQERSTLLLQTKDKENVYQKQINDLKKLQEDIANEIEALDAELRSKVDLRYLPLISSGVLGFPLQGDKSDITQGYGSTSFAKNGYRGRWHNGIDFRASIGTPIFAAENGTILATGNQDLFCRKGAYGKFILIKHNNNLATLYGHLSKYIVSPGETVTRGQVIGYSGKTGYATGPHLHFTVFAAPTLPPADGTNAEGMRPSKSCGPMPYGGDLNPLGYL